VTSRGAIAFVAVAGLLAGCGVGIHERVDVSSDPRLMMLTDPMEMGDRLTVGMTGPDEHAVFPVRITAIEVLATNGFEVVGVGAFDPQELGSGIGGVPGWPPHGYEIPVQGDATFATEWHGPIFTVVGIELTAPMGGLRGIAVSWTDGNGGSHTDVFDYAVLSCPSGACDEDEDAQQALVDLGLVTP
jgi:hypothetical protein